MPCVCVPLLAPKSLSSDHRNNYCWGLAVRLESAECFTCVTLLTPKHRATDFSKVTQSPGFKPQCTWASEFTLLLMKNKKQKTKFVW